MSMHSFYSVAFCKAMFIIVVTNAHNAMKNKSSSDMQPEIIWCCTRSTYFSLVINNMNNNLALWPIFWDNAGKSVPLIIKRNQSLLTVTLTVWLLWNIAFSPLKCRVQTFTNYILPHYPRPDSRLSAMYFVICKSFHLNILSFYDSTPSLINNPIKINK